MFLLKDDNKVKGSLIVIVLLILVICGLCGFICYDKIILEKRVDVKTSTCVYTKRGLYE